MLRHFQRTTINSADIEPWRVSNIREDAFFSTNMMTLFSSGFIESVFIFSTVDWFGKFDSGKQEQALVVWSKIAGRAQTLPTPYFFQILSPYLPLAVLECWSQEPRDFFGLSFVPAAIHILNLSADGILLCRLLTAKNTGCISLLFSWSSCLDGIYL